MEVGGIVKLRWPKNHNAIFIGIVDISSIDDFYVLREPCIVVHESGNIAPLYRRTTINKICCEEEKVKEDDLFLLWKEINKNYSENRKDFEELVFKEMEKYKKK